MVTLHSVRAALRVVVDFACVFRGQQGPAKNTGFVTLRWIRWASAASNPALGTVFELILRIILARVQSVVQYHSRELHV